MEKNTISINKKIAEKVKNIEVKGDIIVPDSKPDIVNIINANSNSYIYKEEINVGKYRFDGNIDTHIIYLSDNGETKCIQTTLNFMDQIEDNIFSAQMSTKYKIEIVGIDTKILNERKLSISVNLKICFEFFECKKIEYLDNLNSLTGIEKLQETMEIDNLIATNKIKSSLKEDLTIDEVDEISEILKIDIDVANIENKISYNKVLSKADVNIVILYSTDNGKFGKLITAIPIMNFIELDKVTDEDVCNIGYKVRNMLFKPNSKEQKSISCQIDFEVCCEVYNKRTIEIVQDMYGINKNITFTKKEVEVQSNKEVPKENVNISQNILVEDIRNLHDVSCIANITNKTPIGNLTNYEGEVCVDIYYEVGNNLNVKEVKIPFMVKMDSSSDNVQINIKRKSFKLNNEEVICDIDMELIPNNKNYKIINIIDNVQEEECEEENDYAMIVYFVKQGDTIWNIARNFKVTRESIIQANNLQDNNRINVGEKLYIVR